MRKLRHDEIPRLAPDELAAVPRHPVVAVLDDIRSLYNVGAIFRTSDAARIEKLYLTGITPTPEHPGMHKTALGAQDLVPWERHRDPLPLVDRLRAAGYTLAVLEITDTPSHIADLDASHFPLCLIVGNEVHGVRDALVARADVALEIPQYGAKQSLNVAVAYGVAVFGLVERCRSLQGLPPHPDEPARLPDRMDA
ncbi:TrmH family RNA methyltransferase [Rhodocaloribacter litoris]|uniref:RNA methyltransferase n=1 Tax=Rhodocaloribacter litoris TaxID=2558931 RepID=UPI00141E18D2|nr:RNA methyltransferase [Rhodocaloribacter litoris]QXD15313.1 TrmH family RNA methyltransferase [Rhodocaloribacter litoris]GIV62320.1 MAG: rRNA methyltransferase [Rhodothermaceae bacterium]